MSHPGTRSPRQPREPVVQRMCAFAKRLECGRSQTALYRFEKRGDGEDRGAGKAGGVARVPWPLCSASASNLSRPRSLLRTNAQSREGPNRRARPTWNGRTHFLGGAVCGCRPGRPAHLQSGPAQVVLQNRRRTDALASREENSIGDCRCHLSIRLLADAAPDLPAGKCEVHVNLRHFVDA